METIRKVECQSTAFQCWQGPDVPRRRLSGVSEFGTSLGFFNLSILDHRDGDFDEGLAADGKNGIRCETGPDPKIGCIEAVSETKLNLMARVLIGTSGWHYQSWRGPFFPKGMPVKNHLQFYASQFATTELNSVFYRTPTPDAVKAWREQTGDDFLFAWKASKFITHWKRLSQKSVNSLELLEDRLSLLGAKAGPILFQLPPHFEADPDRLVAFFKLLPNKRRFSFEFRHPSWYAPPILRLLSHHNLSLCISDHHDAPAPWRRTADFVYVRGHGPQGRYKGHYRQAVLAGWATRIRSWKKQGCDVFVYFDNDQKSAAPADALRLSRLLV